MKFLVAVYDVDKEELASLYFEHQKDAYNFARASMQGQGVQYVVVYLIVVESFGTHLEKQYGFQRLVDGEIQSLVW